MEHILQMQQLFTFSGKHLSYRNTCPTADNPGNILLTYLLLKQLVTVIISQSGLLLSQLALQLWHTAIFKLR